jgi:hypothetical protein
MTLLICLTNLDAKLELDLVRATDEEFNKLKRWTDDFRCSFVGATELDRSWRQTWKVQNQKIQITKRESSISSEKPSH